MSARGPNTTRRSTPCGWPSASSMSATTSKSPANRSCRGKHTQPRSRYLSGRCGYCDHSVAITGSVEVGIDFSQSREFKARAQFANREGTERDLVFVWLNLAIVIEDEHQMGDLLLAKALRYLPG